MTMASIKYNLNRTTARTAVLIASMALTALMPVPGSAQPPAIGTGLLGSLPFDRLTLTDGTVIEVEPVSPRPLPVYDPRKEKERAARKSNRPAPEGNIRLPGQQPKPGAAGEAGDDAVAPEITIHLFKGEARDFKLKRSNLKRIEYFEDILLAEGERCRLAARDYARGFECYLRVQSRVPGWPGLDEHVNRLLFDEGSMP